MNRKPQPKNAAQLVRSFLKAEGLELSTRKALDIVAIIEGYASYQSMAASHNVMLAMTAVPEAAPATPYEKVWADVYPTLLRLMNEIARGIGAMHEWTEPAETRDDQYAVRFEFKLNGEDHYAVFMLLDDDCEAGPYALRFTIEESEGTVQQSWYSGNRFSPQAWTETSEELLVLVSEGFSVDEVLNVIRALKD